MNTTTIDVKSQAEKYYDTEKKPENKRLNRLKAQIDATRGYALYAPTYLDNGITVLPVCNGFKGPSFWQGSLQYRDIVEESSTLRFVKDRGGSLHLGAPIPKFIPEWADRTLDDILNGGKEVDQWYRSAYTGACALTGPNQGGLFGLDVDFEDDNTSKAVASAIDKLLPPSAPIVRRKGSKGFCQFFIVHPDSEFYIPSKLSVEGYGGVDLLFAGRQSVLPPSIHPSGKRYEWTTEDTLEDTHIEDLPVLTEELFNQIIEILGEYGEVSFSTGNARISAGGGGRFKDSFDRFILEKALENTTWLDELGLAKIERVSEKLIVAVPTFRKSSSFRPDHLRKQQLHITDEVVIDRMNGYQYPVQRLIKECLGFKTESEAWDWFYERVPDAFDAEILNIGKSQPVTEPSKPDDEQPYDPAIAAYEEEQEALYANDNEEDDQPEIPVIAPAAIIPAQTTTLAAASAEVDSIVENKLQTSTELNTEINDEIQSLLNDYEVAPYADKASIEKAIKEKASQLPKIIVIKAQTGVGKTKATKKHMFDLASGLRSDTCAIFFPTNVMAEENIKTLAPAAADQTGLYHPPTDTFTNEQGEEQRYCVHPSLDSALEMDIPVETLCKSGGDNGGRCPNYDNCPLLKNNKFLRESDTHMMASHAVALTPCSHRTGKFNTAVFDEEILTAAMSDMVLIKRGLLSVSKLVEVPDITTEERLDYDNFDFVLADLDKAIYLSCDDSEAAGDVPLNISLIESSVININQARGYAVKAKFRIQELALESEFSSVGKLSQQIKRLDKVIKVLNELSRGKNDGIELSGRILIDPKDENIKLYPMGSVDQGLLSKALPVILDATAPDVGFYEGLFDYQIKLSETKYITVKREFEIIEHTAVDRAEGFKVVQVSNAPASSTKLGLREVKPALESGNYSEPTKGQRNRPDIATVYKSLSDGAEGQSMLICNKTYAKWMEATGKQPEGFLSYGSLAGTNTHEQDRVGLIVSHKRLPPEALFKQIGQISGVYCSNRESIEVKRTIQLADGTTQLVSGYAFDDEQAEKLSRWQAERSFIQGVGRLRPYTDKGFEQVVIMLTPEDSGLVVDEVVDWADLREKAKLHQNGQDLAELAKTTPISSSWRFNQLAGLAQPVVIADKIRDMASGFEGDFNKVRLMDLPILESLYTQTQQPDLIKTEVGSIDGGQKFEVCFTSKQDLQDYITEHKLPYKLAESVNWSADAVALTKGDIKLLQGVSNDKASELSKQLSAEIPSSHEVVEFKTLVNGVTPAGRWRRAAVRVGVDPVEAIERCLRVDNVVLRNC